MLLKQSEEGLGRTVEGRRLEGLIAVSRLQILELPTVKRTEQSS